MPSIETEDSNKNILRSSQTTIQTEFQSSGAAKSVVNGQSHKNKLSNFFTHDTPRYRVYGLGLGYSKEK
jgi:hypothetical protein